MGKNNQQQLLKAVAIYPGNPDQHCPFVRKPPLIADVSESWYFRPTQQQQQVTVWAIFKLFEVDLRSQMVQKIILVGRAQAVIYIWYASEGRLHTRHSSSTMYYTMWRYVLYHTHNTVWHFALYYTMWHYVLYYIMWHFALYYTIWHYVLYRTTSPLWYWYWHVMFCQGISTNKNVFHYCNIGSLHSDLALFGSCVCLGNSSLYRISFLHATEILKALKFWN